MLIIRKWNGRSENISIISFVFIHSCMKSPSKITLTWINPPASIVTNTMPYNVVGIFVCVATWMSRKVLHSPSTILISDFDFVGFLSFFVIFISSLDYCSNYWYRCGIVEHYFCSCLKIPFKNFQWRMFQVRRTLLDSLRLRTLLLHRYLSF